MAASGRRYISSARAFPRPKRSRLRCALHWTRWVCSRARSSSSQRASAGTFRASVGSADRGYVEFYQFIPSADAGGTSQSNISQYNNGCSGSHYYSQPNITHNYNYSCASAPTAPAAAPAAAAPPSSEAQQLALREQLADMKAMFEQGLIPSREIYEDKVRQILGLE